MTSLKIFRGYLSPNYVCKRHFFLSSVNSQNKTESSSEFDSRFVKSLWQRNIQPRQKGSGNLEAEPVSSDSFGSLAQKDFVERIANLQRTWGLDGMADDDNVTSSLVPQATPKSDRESDKPSLLFPAETLKTKSKARSHFRFTSRRAGRRTVEWYEEKIQSFVEKGLVREALQLQKIGMAKDKIEPTYQIYRQLIRGCGNVGDMETAFLLYDRMKRCGFSIYGQIYVSLLNSCANFPDGSVAVEKACELWAELQANDFDIGKDPVEGSGLQRVFHAFMKVHIRQGCPDQAFKIYYEMVKERGLEANDYTFSLLLSAATSDQKNGFSKALLIWRSFVEERKIIPSTIHYRRLLSAVVHCSTENGKEVLRLASNSALSLLAEDETSKSSALSVAKNDDDSQQFDYALTKIDESTSFSTPLERLRIFGGVEGIVSLMKCSDESLPDENVFNLLLKCTPDDFSSVRELTMHMNQLNVRPDTEWYDVAVRKLVQVGDLKGVWRCVQAMKERKVPLSSSTFREISKGVKRVNEFEVFLRELREAFVEPDLSIFETLMLNAKKDFQLKERVFRSMVEEFMLEPNDKILADLDRRWTRIKEMNEFQEQFRITYENWWEKKKGREVF